MFGKSVKFETVALPLLAKRSYKECFGSVRFPTSTSVLLVAIHFGGEVSLLSYAHS